MSRCNVATDGTHHRPNQHLDSCPHIDLCSGCLPCTTDPTTGKPADHCTRCARHVPTGHRTCPRCIGKTRTNLIRLANIAGAAHHEAIAQGAATGRAAQLAGPAATYDTWLEHQIARIATARTRTIRTAYQLEAAIARRNDDDAPADLEGRIMRLAAEVTHLRTHETWEETDTQHPDILIGYWTAILRDEHHHEAGGLPPYLHLAKHLDHLAQTDDWPNLAHDLASAVGNAENLIKTRDRQLRGAPCTMCGQTRLVKHHYELFRDDQPVYDDQGLVVANDTWECPNPDCRQIWTEAEYRATIGGEYILSAPYLNATDIAVRFHGLRQSTLASWVRRGQVSKGPRDTSGRITYSTDDIDRLRSHPFSQADQA